MRLNLRRSLQLVFPDRDGHFPWDEGCEPGFRETQDGQLLGLGDTLAGEPRPTIDEGG